MFTILGTLLVVVGVGWLWRRAVSARLQLVTVRELVVRRLAGTHEADGVDERAVDGLLSGDISTKLMQLGHAALDQRGRRVAVGRLRAKVDHQRACVTASIELMPQLGLLGTVVGLIYSMLVRGDTSVTGIGTALATTFVGLLGLLLARLFIEPSADEAHGEIVHLLGTLAVVVTSPLDDPGAEEAAAAVTR